MHTLFQKIIYSFPVQLLAHQFKRNLPLILLWVFFIAVIFGGVGRVYGIHYLFLDPEYLNRVNFLSFFWVGLAFGNFLMSYQITSYILDGHRFSFLGILEKPFGKYFVNNSVIPILVIVIYTIAIASFQIGNQQVAPFSVLGYLIGLFSGILLMIIIMFMYFRFTNQDIFRYLAGSVDKRLRKSRLSRDRLMYKYKESKKKEYQVDYYFDLKLRFRSCKPYHDFYDKAAILRVFDQNHFNSVLLGLIVIVIVFVMGAFIEYPAVQIPAAASCLLLFSIVVILVGAISYWFRGWGVALILGLFILANIISRAGLFPNQNPAKGLNYERDPVEYSLNKLMQISSPIHYFEDKDQMIHALDHWQGNQESEKPKLVFLCVSGGGQRAALWTMTVLQQAEQVIRGSLFNRVFMITGASGGMIGAAYYRELYLRQKLGEDLDLMDEQWIRNIGKDNLNPIIFSLVVNDAFFKIRQFDYAGQTYFKDRGFVFENNLNRNLEGILDRKLSDYAPYENNADIPIMLMSPIISNDGRKLYISSSPVSFMTITEPTSLDINLDQKIRGVDFNRMFRDHGANEVNFLSVLRMSASFPYITPTISLPSEPRIEVMDAGIADNFGIQDALRFAYVMRDWIHRNTSGVVMLVVRDTKKVSPIESTSHPSIIDRFANPISSVYNNLGNIQDIENDNQIEVTQSWLDVPLDVVEFQYDTYTMLEGVNFVFEGREIEMKEIERASLSWHLTAKEKDNIRTNILLDHNQKALQSLRAIFR